MTRLQLEDVAKDLRQLPSLPAVVLDILGSFDDRNADIGMLADKVSRDGALTARTLRLANSSFYGLAHNVTTLHQAITVLGFNSVRTLIIAVAVAGNLPNTTQGFFSLERFWCHSVATALVAKVLARHVRLNGDLAFIAGLLHDIGSLVLATRHPEHYAAVVQYRRNNDCPIIEAERTVLGLDHCTVGMALADYWCFPNAMRDAIACHHEPVCGPLVDFPMLIHVAEAIAHALDLAADPDELVPLLEDEAWERMRLDIPTFDAVCHYAETEFDKACQILRTP